MLCEGKCAKVAVSLLQANQFYVPRNELLFEFMARQLRKHKRLDPVALVNEARKQKILTRLGGHAIFGHLIEKCFDPFNVEMYARIVRECAARREAIREATEKIRLAQSGEMTLPQKARAGVKEVEEDINAEISGARANLDFCSFPMMSKTKCGLPGTITAFCGSPGASKSLFLVQQLWEWFQSGVLVTAMMLESGVKMHLRRVLAQYRNCANLTNDTWVREHEEDVIEHFDAARAFLQRLQENDVLQSVPRGTRPDIDFLIDWVRRQAEAGYRFIAVDPLTKANTGRNIAGEHDRFLEEVEGIVVDHGCTFMFVTHPRDGAGMKLRPSLDSMAGGKGLGRFCDAGWWLESHDWKDVECVNEVNTVRPELVKHNRTMVCTKARNGAGEGQRFALTFEILSLRHRELGRIV